MSRNENLNGRSKSFHFIDTKIESNVSKMIQCLQHAFNLLKSNVNFFSLKSIKWCLKATKYGFPEEKNPWLCSSAKLLQPTPFLRANDIVLKLFLTKRVLNLFLLFVQVTMPENDYVDQTSLFKTDMMWHQSINTPKLMLNKDEFGSTAYISE